MKPHYGNPQPKPIKSLNAIQNVKPTIPTKPVSTQKSDSGQKPSAAKRPANTTKKP
jgi:hypothetical protein